MIIISLFTAVLLLQTLIYVVNAVGAKAINELLWQFSARLPLASSKDAQDQLRLRREVLRLKKEMNAISAQDDFAKWAKIRREHDKAMAAHDQKGTAVSGHRASFDSKANIARWLLTTGLKMFLQFWHARQPVFTYPLGWLPWPVEWILAFPRCSYGAVSINIWSMVCATIVAFVGDAIGELIVSKATTQSKVGVEMKAGKQSAEKQKPRTMSAASVD